MIDTPVHSSPGPDVTVLVIVAVVLGAGAWLVLRVLFAIGRRHWDIDRRHQRAMEALRRRRLP